MDTGYKISDLMVQRVLTAEPTATVKECAKLMADKQIGSLVIADNKKIVGIVTEQDMSRKVVAKALDYEASVSEILTKKLVDIMPTDDIYTAMVRMSKYNIKHLPVVSAGKLVGIISFKDIIRAEPALLEKWDVGGR